MDRCSGQSNTCVIGCAGRALGEKGSETASENERGNSDVITTNVAHQHHSPQSKSWDGRLSHTLALALALALARAQTRVQQKAILSPMERCCKQRTLRFRLRSAFALALVSFEVHELGCQRGSKHLIRGQVHAAVLRLGTPPLNSSRLRHGKLGGHLRVAHHPL